MLTPEYLDQLPDSVIALYQQAEMDILKDMARRILSVGEMTSTAEYQMRRLEAMGASREYIFRYITEGRLQVLQPYLDPPEVNPDAVPKIT